MLKFHPILLMAQCLLFPISRLQTKPGSILRLIIAFDVNDFFVVVCFKEAFHIPAFFTVATLNTSTSHLKPRQISGKVSPVPGQWLDSMSQLSSSPSASSYKAIWRQQLMNSPEANSPEGRQSLLKPFRLWIQTMRSEETFSYADICIK